MPLPRIAKFIGILLLPLSLSAFAETGDRVISVRGFGVVEVESNQGKVGASVTSKEMSPSEALAANNARVQAVFDALNSAGIGNDDIRTTHFNFYKEYRYEGGTRIFDGYAVTNGIEVTVDEVGELGAILDLLVDAGADNVSSVRFDSKRTELMRRQAIIRATRDAFNKATVLANQTGVVLGAPAQITLRSSASITPEAATNTSFQANADSTVPISPGTNAVTATVWISYSIE